MEKEGQADRQGQCAGPGGRLLGRHKDRGSRTEVWIPSPRVQVRCDYYYYDVVSLIPSTLRESGVGEGMCFPLSGSTCRLVLGVEREGGEYWGEQHQGCPFSDTGDLGQIKGPAVARRLAPVTGSLNRRSLNACYMLALSWGL